MENIKKILVPTDFSPNATKALDYAVQVARLTNASIYLLHVVETKELMETTEAYGQKMEIISESIQLTNGIRVEPNLISGLVIDTILHTITTDHIDLVIMGTVGNTRLKEKIFGSKTARIIGQSPKPILAIPLLSEWNQSPNILLAINDFNVEVEKLAPVIQLAGLMHSIIQVAIFTDTDDDYVEEYQEHEMKIAAFRDALKMKYPDLEIHAVHLASRKFMDSLFHWIDEHTIGMLVMLTHKRKIIEGVFNRSLTKKLSYHTNIPLLAIPV